MLYNVHYLGWREEDVHDRDGGGIEASLDVAMRVIRRRREPQLVMPSGPIGSGGVGDPRQNIDIFAATVEALHLRHAPVFSVIPFEKRFVKIIEAWKGAGNAGYCMPILEVFYRAILKTGRIKAMCFIPNWQSSFGSCWERRECERLDIQCIDLPLDFIPEYELVRRRMARELTDPRSMARQAFKSVVLLGRDEDDEKELQPEELVTD